jgi:hypothetical protein
VAGLEALIDQADAAHHAGQALVVEGGLVVLHDPPGRHPRRRRRAGGTGEGQRHRDALRPDRRRDGVFHVDVAPRAHAPVEPTHVALGVGEVGEEGALEPRSLGGIEFTEQREGPGGVAHQDHALLAGDVVEEPAARREHEQGTALQLQQPQRPHALVDREGRAGVGGEEAVGGARIEASLLDDVDEGVAGRPWIAQQDRGGALVDLGEAIAQAVERRAQAGAPALVPCRVGVHAAAAVALPAADAMGARPGAHRVQLDVAATAEALEEGGVVDDLDVVAGVEAGKRSCERHVAKAEVMAIALTVGRRMHEPRFVGGGGAVREGALDGVDEVAGVAEEALEGDAASEGAVIKEYRHLTTALCRVAIGAAGRDAALPAVDPLAAIDAEAAGLKRREDGKGDALVGEDLHRVGVDGGLGKPDAAGRTAEGALEGAQPPAHLRIFIAAIAEGHDRMVVDLRNRVAVAEAGDAVAIGSHHRVEGLGHMAREPRRQRRPDVEAEAGVVVVEAHDAALPVEDASPGVGRVALLGDAAVPVVVRRRRRLTLEVFKPGVLARGLVEVPVDADHQLRRRRRHTHLTAGRG